MVKGIYNTDTGNTKLFVNGIQIDINKTHNLGSLTKHSYDFNWGYGGSGPAQTALAILYTLYGKDVALRYYQDFKWDMIAPLEQACDFTMAISDIEAWMERERA